MPNFYIIAGCNGAGKTTTYFTLLPDLLNCREFVNANEIVIYDDYVWNQLNFISNG